MNELVYYDEIAQSLSKAVKWGGENLKNIPGLLKMVLEQGMWRKRAVAMTGQIVEFQSFEQFAEANAPEGLGSDVKTLLRLCADEPKVLSLLETETKKTLGENGRPNEETVTRNSLRPAQRGNTREYAVARLDRDGHTELAEQVLNREITAAEARRQAGYEKRKISIQMDDAESAARTIAKHIETDVLAELLALLAEEMHRRDQEE